MENRDNFDKEMSEVLVDAILKFEFLRVKASSPVMLQFSNSETSSTGKIFCTNLDVASLTVNNNFSFCQKVLQFLFCIITPDLTLSYMSTKIGYVRSTTLPCHHWNT